MEQLIYILIIVTLLFSIYGSFSLSVIDFKKKNVCPKVFGIPACYIVFIFFLLAIYSHFMGSGQKINLLYFGFLAVPFLLALGGSLTELSGRVICPRTRGGMPMCYISLGICTSLLILKVIETNLN